jgi:hypothetical protein
MDELTSDSSSEGMTQLGEQLENPYSVENMKRALDNLRKSQASGRISADGVEITTTHLYLKFKPKNEAEMAILKRDSTLILFNYPLDYPIVKEGDYYHDPTIPLDRPTYQYTSVTVDKELPSGVEYEVLAELFIPDEEKDGVKINGRLSEEIVEELVNEALRITGNLENKSSVNGRIQSSSWRPSERVRVWDDRAARFVPVVGIEVRAKRWFTVHTGTTNSFGNYSCNGTFKRQADYSINWETYHFSVRSGTFGQAENSRSNLEGSWNPDYGALNSTAVNNTQQYYALIFQAARDYYYGHRFALSSPPRNSGAHPQVKIAANVTERQNEKPSHAAMYARTGGILPSIYIRKWESRSDIVYAVTAHELAHAAHWDMDRAAFLTLVIGFGVLGNESKNAVVESWASGVEWQFAQERYRGLLGIVGYEYGTGTRDGGNYQKLMLSGFTNWPNDLIYTSIVVDMIDDENQRFTRGHSGSIAYPQDRVGGYTIQQIEEGLLGATTWNEWRNSMINRHDNPSEGNLNELFANWY